MLASFSIEESFDVVGSLAMLTVSAGGIHDRCIGKVWRRVKPRFAEIRASSQEGR